MTDFRTIGIVQGLERSMSHLSARQRVISENVANVSTPGYRARDVERPSFAPLLEQTKKAAMRSNPSAGISTPTVTRPVIASRADQLTPRIIGLADEQRTDGNDVLIEAEMLKMSEAQADYAAAANMYRKTRTILRTAIGRQ